jgi:hypothetical protein
MKTFLLKKTFWQSLFSVVLLGFFIWIASGSFGIITTQTKYLGDGVYETTREDGFETVETITGKMDEYGNRTGNTIIKWNYRFPYIEEINFTNGKRHGKGKYTSKNGNIEYRCYNMGVVVECGKSAFITNEKTTGYQLLSTKYPWFLFPLNAFGFDNSHVEEFINSIEKIMASNKFDEDAIDSTYEAALDSVSNLPKFDSISKINSILIEIGGMDLARNSELRLAVIDRYRSNGKSTFEKLNTTYPGYLDAMKTNGVTNQDFEVFSHNLDSIMFSYGLLDVSDVYFLDSIDARMYRALNYISSIKTSSVLSMVSLKSTYVSYKKKNYNAFYTEAKVYLNQRLMESTPTDIASMVIILMYFEGIYKGDMIRKVVEDAYFINKGVKSIPIVTTAFENSNSNTIASINGTVIETGGANVTARGIAWAITYNPTVEDHAESSGSGLGDFSVRLTGLSKDVIYYARAYATNSAGTAYGNIVMFKTNSGNGTEEMKPFSKSFSIYPNPVASISTVSFKNETSGIYTLKIFNLKGQQVLRKELGTVQPGVNQYILNLSTLSNGPYNCLLSNGQNSMSQKIVVLR